MSDELIPVPATQPMGQMTTANAMLFDQALAARAWKVASLYAASTLVPMHFQNRPENVFIMLQLAARTGQDLFMLLQNCYVVHGRPGFEAKYMIGQLATSGKTKGLLKFEFSGTKGSDDYGCTAWCIEAATEERIDGPKVSWATVKAEGWNIDKPMKSGGVQKSKWNTKPELMFRYRAAAFLIRTTFPDVLMGLQTKEELEDSVIDVAVTNGGSKQAIEEFIIADVEVNAEEQEVKNDFQAETAPLAEPQPAPEPLNEPYLVACYKEEIAKVTTLTEANKLVTKWKNDARGMAASKEVRDYIDQILEGCRSIQRQKRAGGPS